MLTINTSNPTVQAFFDAYIPQRNIIREFYEKLPEDKYDFSMVKDPNRKSDTPRQSLAHILEYRLLVFDGVKTGKFEFKSMGVEHYYSASKQELLEEWDKIERQFVDFCCATNFDAQKEIEMPWGGTLSAAGTLYLIRDHEILHVGWNLAFMDLLGIDRFQSLIDAWG